MAESKNRDIANSVLSGQMESTIPFISTNIAPKSEIPEIVSSQTDETNAASVVNNNYNVNVNVEGKTTPNINNNSTTNIVKNVVEQNNSISPQVLKKNSQTNFIESGSNSNLTSNEESRTNLINNYLKNEQNTSLTQDTVNNKSNNLTNITTNSSNSIMPSLSESSVQMETNNSNVSNSSNSSTNNTNFVTNSSNSIMPSLSESSVQMETNVSNSSNSSNSSTNNTILESSQSNSQSQNLVNSENNFNLNNIQLTDYANPDNSVGNINKMETIKDGNDTTDNNILYNENTFVQKREEKINQIIGHVDSDNNITTNQNNSIIDSSNIKTVEEKNQNLNNFTNTNETYQNIPNESVQNLSVTNNQQNLNSENTFNMSNFSENMSNNSFVTTENASSKINFTSNDIDSSQDDKIAEISKIVREKSLKDAQTALKEEEVRKENKNKKISEEIDDEDGGASESVDMQQDGGKQMDMEDKASGPIPLASRGERREFPHLNATPSDISIFYKKMHSPPIWRTVSG